MHFILGVCADLYLWPESRYSKSSLHIQLIQMNFTLINGFYSIFIAFHSKSWFVPFMSRFSKPAKSCRANKIWFRASMKFTMKLRSFQNYSMHSERMMLLKLHCINKCGDGRYVATTPLRQYLSLTAHITFMHFHFHWLMCISCKYSKRYLNSSVEIIRNEKKSKIKIWLKHRSNYQLINQRNCIGSAWLGLAWLRQRDEGEAYVYKIFKQLN